MFVPIVVKLVIPSCVATSLLDILNGGIFRKNHGSTLLGKLRWPHQVQAFQVRRGLRCLLLMYHSQIVLDIMTLKTLGCGVKRGHLYHLELTTTDKGQYNKVCFATKGDWSLSEVWFWHKRLGYLSFSYLKKLKPNLFTKL